MKKELRDQLEKYIKSKIVLDLNGIQVLGHKIEKDGLICVQIQKDGKKWLVYF